MKMCIKSLCPCIKSLCPQLFYDDLSDLLETLHDFLLLYENVHERLDFVFDSLLNYYSCFGL